MGCEEEVLGVGKKLDKMISNQTTDHTSVLDLLKTLQDLPMSLDVLQKTRIGMTVNNLRKASKSEEVISLAKTLIKSWKKLLPGETTQSNKSGSSSSSKMKIDETSNDSTDVQNEKEESKPKTASDTTDAIRLKCRELLTTALKCDNPPENSGNPSEIASAIEDYIFMEFTSTNPKYKNRVRSRVANLKDSKNPQLRAHVLIGVISPQRMANMPAEEMANEEMRKLRQKLTKESIDDHQMAKNEGTVSDLFKCGKCGQYNTTYTQLQTRSSDEPMTTFVFCNVCGNRWKFC
ncbi:transcription elongation factor S-II [Patella vulgata]|uniref:transcription elongation factor S-II n=1 Tax=Patella vulgata TaxID=6465 RepID=UPI00217F258A|nr:transcription elongation factor S-II [Patella vulgata]